MPAEERLTSVEGLATLPDERLAPELERDTLPVEREALPVVVDLRLCVLVDGRDAALPLEREALPVERETLPEERLEPELERLAELPEVVDLRF